MTEGTRRGDPHRMLIRALQDRAGPGDPAIVAAARSEAWASATFRGARHAVSLHFAGADATARAARLAEEMDAIEFDLPGHLVADIAVAACDDSAGGTTLAIEALTVEDA